MTTFAAGDLVRVFLQLRSGGWTAVAGQVRRVKRDHVVVATLAGIRAVSTLDIVPFVSSGTLAANANPGTQ